MTDRIPAGPGGRPSKYDPAFCDLAIEWMSQGYSIAGFAGKIGVSRESVYKWAKEHPEFSDALTAARAASAAWWEERSVELASGKEGAGNPTMIVFGLKNRVADEWRDSNRTEITGANGGPIETKDVSATELARRLAFLLASGIEEQS